MLAAQLLLAVLETGAIEDARACLVLRLILEPPGDTASIAFSLPVLVCTSSLLHPSEVDQSVTYRAPLTLAWAQQPSFMFNTCSAHS